MNIRYFMDNREKLGNIEFNKPERLLARNDRSAQQFWNSGILTKEFRENALIGNLEFEILWFLVYYSGDENQ